MSSYDFNNVDLFEGRTKAQRIAKEIFQDDFHTCMDKMFEDLHSDFKTYSDLTIGQGQIRLVPGIKNKIRAFIQWCRDKYRLGRDPANSPFPDAQTAALIRRYKTHEKYIKDSATIADAAKPEKFTSSTKWEDWAPTFINYLRAIPGRDGIPLKYVVRENNQPDPTPQLDFLDEYINMAPLNGLSYAIDAAQVHTFVLKLITGNEVAEA